MQHIFEVAPDIHVHYVEPGAHDVAGLTVAELGDAFEDVFFFFGGYLGEFNGLGEFVHREVGSVVLHTVLDERGGLDEEDGYRIEQFFEEDECAARKA